MTEEWRTDRFRSTMVRQLEAVIQERGLSNHNAQNTENTAFQKARSKEEYLNYVAKLILMIKQRNPQQQQQQPGPGGDGQQHIQGGPPQSGGGNMMHGNSGNMMPRYPVPPQQQLNPQEQQQQQQRMMQGQQGQMQQQQQQWQAQQNWGQQGMPRQGGPRPRMPMGAYNATIQRQPMMTANQGGPNQGPPPRYNISSMAQQRGQQPMQHMGGQQSVPSPGGFIPSPAMMQQQQPSPRNIGLGAPSPLNTGIGTPKSVQDQSGAQETPFLASPNNTPEDQEYFEKVKQLGNKYIEPLRNMINNLGKNEQEKQNLAKMNKLMEILSNPYKRITNGMDTLLKCESVLEKMLKGKDTQHQQQAILNDGVSSTSGMNPLLEAIVKIRSAEQKNQTGSSVNHTLNRSLKAPLDSILGCEITLPPLPKKLKQSSTCDASTSHESSIDIPDVLQGEVARLQPQFKVSLDAAQPTHFSNNIMLICHLEDKDLPSVPPLGVIIPQNYPDVSAPICGSDQDLFEYQFTPFLSSVKEALQSRLAKMPQKYSLSQLLSAWEMSVRAACSVKSVPVTQQTILMGL